MSRRMPHFNRESLEVELSKLDIRYLWMKELGGRRKKIRDDSPNGGLRNDSFRNYADYMLTPEFEKAIERLLELARDTANPSTHPTLSRNSGEEDGGPMVTADGVSGHSRPSGHVAIMCAERVYFQCHRMLVSDYLTAHGNTVLHIDDEKHAPRPHKLMAEAHLGEGKLIYNALELFPGDM